MRDDQHLHQALHKDLTCTTCWLDPYSIVWSILYSDTSSYVLLTLFVQCSILLLVFGRGWTGGMKGFYKEPCDLLR